MEADSVRCKTPDHLEQTALSGVERESETQPPMEEFFPAKPAQDTKQSRQAVNVASQLRLHGHGSKQTGEKTRSGPSSTEYGATGEIVPKAAITVSRADDLSGDVLHNRNSPIHLSARIAFCRARYNHRTGRFAVHLLPTFHRNCRIRIGQPVMPGGSSER